MLTLALALALTQTPQHRLVMQPNLPRNAFAFFELAPASGAGMTGVCATTAPTGAKGEALTLTRTTAATCTKGTNGTRSTGIADGDLVSLASGVIRQEFDGDAVLGVRIEPAATNLLLRYIAIDNAAWSDVGTPSLTTGQTDPFGTTGAVSIDDNDGAAFEGRSQTVTVSAGAAHTMHCYVKAGTRAEARITLDGTAATITGLSSSTWSIIEVTDASSSGTSIAAVVLSGDATGDTGTVIFGGCQVETRSGRTSIIPTAGTTVTRNLDALSVAIGFSPVAQGSHAISFTIGNTQSDARLLRYEANAIPLYMSAPFQYVRLWDGTNNPSVATGAMSVGTTYRAWSSYSGASSTVVFQASSASAGFDGSMGSTATLSICNGDGTALGGICSRACADPGTGRCR